MTLFGYKYYKVTVNGQNFITNINGNVQNRGFFAPRIIKAKNVNQAKEMAMNTILNDGKLLSVIVKDEAIYPELHVESVEVLSKNIVSSINIKEINNSYMFFEMDTAGA